MHEKAFVGNLVPVKCLLFFGEVWRNFGSLSCFYARTLLLFFATGSTSII